MEIQIQFLIYFFSFDAPLIALVKIKKCVMVKRVQFFFKRVINSLIVQGIALEWNLSNKPQRLRIAPIFFVDFS